MITYSGCKAILWALWTPQYRRALKQAFRDNLEMDRLATDCAIYANKDVAWVKRLKRVARRKNNPVMWLHSYCEYLQHHGDRGEEWTEDV